jgi:hypothetical protein
LLPGNDATRELAHSFIVLGLLLPANEQSSEAIDPGMPALDHPAPGLIVWMAGRRLALFTAASDMGRQVVVVGDLPGAVIVRWMPRQRRKLTVEDRVAIDLRRKDGWGVRAIARELGRSPSVISTEIGRGREPDGTCAAGSAQAAEAVGYMSRILELGWLRCGTGNRLWQMGQDRNSPVEI